MKKTLIALLLVLVVATPSYAVSIIDKMLCKQVVLRSNNGAIVLVNRITGQVECVMSSGQSVPLTKELKKQFQMVYDAQERPARK